MSEARVKTCCALFVSATRGTSIVVVKANVVAHWNEQFQQLGGVCKWRRVNKQFDKQR